MTAVIKVMSCPDCATEEIAQTASTYAKAQALKEENSTCSFIDLYMMYYRITYSRLYEAQTETCAHKVDPLTESDYEETTDSPWSKFDFNAKVQFCFHEAGYDEFCANCVQK